MAWPSNFVENFQNFTETQQRVSGSRSASWQNDKMFFQSQEVEKNSNDTIFMKQKKFCNKKILWKQRIHSHA